MGKDRWPADAGERRGGAWRAGQQHPEAAGVSEAHLASGAARARACPRLHANELGEVSQALLLRQQFVGRAARATARSHCTWAMGA